MTEIFVTMAVLIIGLILSVYWQQKAAKDEEKRQQEANRKEIDRLLSFDEADIYR